MFFFYPHRVKEELHDDNIGISEFAPTRWTVKAKAFKSIIDNYPLLVETFERDLEKLTSMPPDMRARISGTMANMSTFDTYFSIELVHFFSGTLTI